MKLTQKEKMREIKFRGKRVDNGEWVYGYYLVDEDDGYPLPTIFTPSGLGDKNIGDGLHHVDPATVGQYTGMEDINGKEIYEGDIVKMHYFFDNFDPYTFGAYEDEKEIIGVVGIDGMGTYTVCDDKKYYWLDYMEYPQEELEVIGNIYDNPELLKNKNKEED